MPTLYSNRLLKEAERNNFQPLIIHYEKLNNGHISLNNINWIIIPISIVDKIYVNEFNEYYPIIIILDEAQRIRSQQLDLILKISMELNIPIIFSYDVKQYLKKGESKEIYEYISKEFPENNIARYVLKDKIRINKNMASFIKNFIHIGTSKEDINYENITI